MKPNFCTIIVDIASFEVLLLLPALIIANSVIATPRASGKRTPRPSARIRKIEQSQLLTLVTNKRPKKRPKKRRKVAATVTATPAQVVEVVEEVEDDYKDPLARDTFTRKVDEAGSSGAELADNPIEGVAKEEEEEDSNNDKVQEPPLPSNYVYTS